MKLVRYVLDQAPALAGTGLVLITLSGSTRTYGIWMSVIATILHFLSYVLPEEDDEE